MRSLPARVCLQPALLVLPAACTGDCKAQLWHLTYKQEVKDECFQGPKARILPARVCLQPALLVLPAACIAAACNSALASSLINAALAR